MKKGPDGRGVQREVKGGEEDGEINRKKFKEASGRVEERMVKRGMRKIVKKVEKKNGQRGKWHNRTKKRGGE